MHAAIEFAEFHDLPKRWLVGWSFGTELVLMHGRDPSIEGAILLSPPLHRATDADLDAWAEFGKPLVVLVPELDDYLRPDEARRRFARVPAGGGHRRRRREAPVGGRVRGPARARRDRRPRAARPPGPAAHHLDRPEHDRGGRRMSLHTYRDRTATDCPLVLLHGFPLDHRMWDEVAAPAAAAGRAGARGRPARARPGTRADLPEPALEASADLVADGAARARASTAPSSPACRWAATSRSRSLERHPDLVAGLALVDTKSTADTPEARANRLRIADEAEQTGSVDPVRPMASSLLGETTRSSRPEVADEVAGLDRRAGARRDRVVAARDGRPAGPLGRAPRVRRPGRGRRRRRGHGHARSRPPSTWSRPPPSARLVVVPRAGHLSSVEQPAAVAAALADLAQAADPA